MTDLTCLRLKAICRSSVGVQLLVSDRCNGVLLQISNIHHNIALLGGTDQSVKQQQYLLVMENKRVKAATTGACRSLKKWRAINTYMYTVREQTFLHKYLFGVVIMNWILISKLNLGDKGIMEQR